MSKIVVGLVYAFGGLIVVLSTAVSYTTENVVIDALSDCIILFASVFVSFQFAKIAAAEAAKTRVEDLGKATIRRIRLLYNDIQTLAERVASYPGDGEITNIRNQNTVDVLQRLLNAVKASFDEIKQTANLPQVDDADLYTLPDTELEFPNSQGMASNKVSCPNCKLVQDVVVASHAGASGHVNCGNCQAIFPVHRKIDGNLFTGGAAGTKAALSVRSFNCTKCGEDGHFKYKPDIAFVERSCLHCFQAFRYLVADDRIEPGETKSFSLEWDGVPSVEFDCHGCGSHIGPARPYKNLHGQQIMFCLSCGTPTVLTRNE